jgi:hypothetical protein
MFGLAFFVLEVLGKLFNKIRANRRQLRHSQQALQQQQQSGMPQTRIRLDFVNVRPAAWDS